MQLNPLDPNGNPWNEPALEALGATMIGYPPGSGPVVQPTIDISGYAAAAAIAVKAALIAAATALQQKIAGGGITVNVAASGSPVNVEASTDPASLVLLQGAATIAAANPSQTFQWVPNTGSPITLTATQITLMFAAVSAFIQSTFTTLAAVITAVNAGTVTTMAQVDSFASPAWPVNS